MEQRVPPFEDGESLPLLLDGEGIMDFGRQPTQILSGHSPSLIADRSGVDGLVERTWVAAVPQARSYSR